MSKHIFRYDHHRDDDEGYINIHTVNECAYALYAKTLLTWSALAILIDSYMEMIHFFAMLILNMDEASL